MRVNSKLIFFCGKMGSGKTTMSREIAKTEKAVLLSEDKWLQTLYPNEINDFVGYAKYSSRLKQILQPHIESLLNAGVSVVLDFPGNTRAQRAWFKEIISACQIEHKLIYIEASDKLCLTQIHLRQQSEPERAKFDTEEMFKKVTKYFEAPTQSEGFNIEVTQRSDA